MTKQEIEKAIKNGESVWYADTYNRKVWEINLSEKYKPEIYLDGILYVYENINDRFKQELFVEDLHKTRAEAEHYLYHKNVTRTKTLPFLTWEEFNMGLALHFQGKNEFNYDLFIYKNYLYLQRGDMPFNMAFTFGKANEENFYKAYNECVKLFREWKDL